MTTFQFLSCGASSPSQCVCVLHQSTSSIMLHSESPEAFSAMSGSPLPPLVLSVALGLLTNALLQEEKVRRSSNLQEAKLLED